MRTSSIILIYYIAVLLFAVSCQSRSDYAIGIKGGEQIFDGEEPSRAEKEKRWKEGFAYVTKVIDGDTFWVDNGRDSFKVRFIGIDAPETRNSRWKEKGYYAQEAKEYVRSKTENQWVRLEMDVQSHDRYRRLLAYVYLEDGTFLNSSLVEQGYAVVDTYPPNVKYVKLFMDMQRQARDNNRGLWGELPE